MLIEDAVYQQDENGNNIAIICTIDGVGDTNVPILVGNRHYDEIKRQMDAGTLTIQDAD